MFSFPHSRRNRSLVDKSQSAINTTAICVKNLYVVFPTHCSTHILIRGVRSFLQSTMRNTVQVQYGTHSFRFQSVTNTELVDILSNPYTLTFAGCCSTFLSSASYKIDPPSKKKDVQETSYHKLHIKKEKGNNDDVTNTTTATT